MREERFILAQGSVHHSRKGMVMWAHGGGCVPHGRPGIRKKGQYQVLIYSIHMAQFHQSPLALQVPESSKRACPSWGEEGDMSHSICNTIQLDGAECLQKEHNAEVA